MPNAESIISVDEAMEFLNITDFDSASEISGFIESASQMWERRVGPVEGSPTYSEWYDGGRRSIVLRHTPVQSITSITESYTSSLIYTLTAEPLDGVIGGDAYGYTFDNETGVLTRRMNGMPASFAHGVRNVHVTYVAGYIDPPADIKEAIKLLVKHKWETQRGSSRRPGSDVDVAAGSSYAWPRRVEEIAAGYTVPGIA